MNTVKQRYIEELTLQLNYVTDVNEWEDIAETIRYLEESTEV